MPSTTPSASLRASANSGQALLPSTRVARSGQAGQVQGLFMIPEKNSHLREYTLDFMVSRCI